MLDDMVKGVNKKSKIMSTAIFFFNNIDEFRKVFCCIVSPCCEIGNPTIGHIEDIKIKI